MTRRIFFDLEADGLYHFWEPEAATGIDCAVALVEDEEGEHWEEWNPGRFLDAAGAVCIAHNMFDYDLPMLKKFWGWQYDILPDTWCGQRVKFVDTMLLSKLLNPDRKVPAGFYEQWEPAFLGQKPPGPHSLDVWGYRLGVKKPKLVYGEAMQSAPYEVKVAQAKADIEITRKLYKHLAEEAKQLGVNLKEPLAVEQAVRHIMHQGAEHGVCFDKELAERCIPELDGFMQEIAERVEPQLPPRRIPQSKVKLPPKILQRSPPPKSKRFKRNGEPNKASFDYFGEALYQAPPDDVWCVHLAPDEHIPLRDWPEDDHRYGEPTKHCRDYFVDALYLCKHEQQWRVRTGKHEEPQGVALHKWPADRPFGEATEPMLISHQQDIKQWLQEQHGWKPTIWNIKKLEDGSIEKTSPKFHQNGKLCENLEQLAEVVPIVKDITLWLSYRNRRSVIKSENGTGWLNHPRLAIDGRLPADADTMGTSTFRFTHRVVANVPRPGSVYGENMRGMFRAPEGQVAVGWDASQLEDRCKAHYCYGLEGGKEYVQKILDPDFDVHQENADNWGMPRQKTKGGHYALQYNCRPAKLAETLGIDLATAKEYYADWWERNAPLALLTEKLDEICDGQYNGRWVPGIDGRLVPCRAKHARVNTLLQSAGVIAMKYAMVIWWLNVRRLKLPAVQVVHYHDEAFSVCAPGYAQVVGELGEYSIKKAGEKLNFRVPLLSEYKQGESWKDIH